MFGVNPYRDTVAGDPCWSRVTDLPEKPTMAVFVVPAKRGLGVLEDCAEAGIKSIWIQPGAFSRELGDALEAGGFDWLSEACVMVRARTAVG